MVKRNTEVSKRHFGHISLEEERELEENLLDAIDEIEKGVMSGKYKFKQKISQDTDYPNYR